MKKQVEILEQVEEIARKAGDILMDYYGRIREIDYKGVGDIVTEADKASEKLIARRLESLFPEHAFLGEEFGMSETQSDYCWVADPLDGTANYAARFPNFAVAIALLHAGHPTLGVVFDPNADLMFSAIKGNGATLNDAPIHVNHREKLDALGLFGFSSGMMESLHPFMRRSAKGRSLGSAALQICSVAAGYYDGSIDLTTKLWDVAAAAMILEEAGGVITHPSGASLFPLSPNDPAYQGGVVPFLATNGLVHEACLGILAEADV